MAEPLGPIRFYVVGDAPRPEDREGGFLVLYLDTSALIKLYVAEKHSDVVERAVRESIERSVSEIGELEARAALARAYHLGEISEGEMRDAIYDFKLDLRNAKLVRYDEDLALAAGELALKHGDPPLRSYDALHLASALEAFRPVRNDPGYDCRVLAFDRRLCAAVRAEGLALYFDPFSATGEQGE